MKATVNIGYINISNTWYKLQNKAQISKQEKTLRFQTLSFSFKIKFLHIVFSLYVVFYLSFLFPPRFRPMLFSAGLRRLQGQITPNCWTWSVSWIPPHGTSSASFSVRLGTFRDTHDTQASGRTQRTWSWNKTNFIY